MDNNSKIRKIIKTTLNEWLNEQQNIKSSDEIIDIVYDIHRNPSDFEDDDDFSGLATTIRKYDNYKLEEIDISDIGKHHIKFDHKRVEKIMSEIQQNPNYPPIVYDKDIDLIIDGVHRFEALKLLGVKKIKTWVGF